MSRNWTDRIVGTRMAVDREFEERLGQSEFERQEWGLVMTAVEFDIENPEDPESARLVGDTENLPAIVPELERIANENPMGGGSKKQSSGVLGSLKNALGMGGDDSKFDESKVQAAEALVAEYTDMLQARLEDNGRWAEICEAARTSKEAEGADADPLEK
ncbi:DUF5799 family protein [Halomarina litorea]|uniref:DUF5799 family protein n=1 Tax=Halomarina litorea TaxID=2961595 RepID=UPI0020C227BF|nr:DUF5799 family protein [Halomarina sp. BCD28]